MRSKWCLLALINALLMAPPVMAYSGKFPESEDTKVYVTERRCEFFNPYERKCETPEVKETFCFEPFIEREEEFVPFARFDNDGQMYKRQEKVTFGGWRRCQP